jgi:hypothetical protein
LISRFDEIFNLISGFDEIINLISGFDDQSTSAGVSCKTTKKCSAQRSGRGADQEEAKGQGV